MENKGPLGGEEILQPEVILGTLPPQKNLITVMVLSVALAHQVLGKDAPKKGKINPGQGKKVITAIETAIKKTYPDIAPMILGMFGLEMLNLMPLLQDPDTVVKEIIADYTAKNSNASPSPIPGLV